MSNDQPGTTPRVCACGCGLAPRTNRSIFLPGHDRRYMGIIAHAVRHGDEKIRDERDPQGAKRPPMEIAKEVFTDAGMKKLQGEIEREVKPRSSKSNGSTTPKEPAKV